MSMCMTYGPYPVIHPAKWSLLNLRFPLVSCLGLVWKSYSLPNDWSVGSDLLCHTLGTVGRFPLPLCGSGRL
jgi:hypothetical protein